jgi:hypothetical protein
MAEERGGEETEERAVEAGEAAVKREVRLREPDDWRDDDGSEREGGGGAGA